VPFLDSRVLFAAICAGVLFASFAPTHVHAQATRTWVSGVGDDANPCSRTAPCKTFAGAISKTAAGGEISALDPGGYGAVTITKSITIDGGGTLASILAALTNGIIINAPNIIVKIRNITISGAGTGFNGVRFLNGGSLTLQNVVIENFTQEAVRFSPSATADLVIANSMLRTSDMGIRSFPSAGAIGNVMITNTIIEGNANIGVRVEDGTFVTIRDSVLQGNGTEGVSALSWGGSVDASISNTTSSRNGTNGFVAQVAAGAGTVSVLLDNASSVLNAAHGVVAAGAATIRIANTRIWKNAGSGIATAGAGQVLSQGNNTNQANGANGAPTGAFGLQ
jgi:hypothetical protein